MKKLFVCLMIVALASFSRGEYTETFDGGTANWIYGYGTNYVAGTTEWSATGGNPEAHISGLASNLYAVWTTDTAVYGDLTGLTLTMDTKITGTLTNNAQFYVGRNGEYYISEPWSLSTDMDWTTHAKTLDSSNFSLWYYVPTTNSLDYVLSAPDEIGLFFGASLADGDGSLSIDNLGAIPEPAVLGLIGLFGVAFIAVRRIFLI